MTIQNQEPQQLNTIPDQQQDTTILHNVPDPSEAATKQNVSVTAACLYPALRLDKLYAALIRCLVLWTVTKQILVSCFRGLYILTGGSDVTHGISCDSSLHRIGSDVILHTLPSLYLHALWLSNYESSYLVALTLAKSCED